MTHGYKNEKFHDLIHCMLDHGALEQYPQFVKYNLHNVQCPLYIKNVQLLYILSDQLFNSRMVRAKEMILML